MDFVDFKQAAKFRYARQLKKTGYLENIIRDIHQNSQSAKKLLYGIF